MREATDGLLVLYECRLTFPEACRLGAEFLQLCGQSGNELAYGVPGKDGAHKTRRVKSVASLAAKLDDTVQYVVLAHVFDDDPSEHVTFYYGRDAVTPEYARVIVAWRGARVPSLRLADLLPLAASAHGSADGGVPYGFGTHLSLSDVTPYEYADAQSVFRPFLPYENPDLWMVEVPSYLAEAPSRRRYLSGMLRLVYEVNFLRDAHLAMPIDGSDLRQWIEARPDERGTLAAIAPGLWVWQVPVAALPSVNTACAAAGLLIAWAAPKPAADGRRRLP